MRATRCAIYTRKSSEEGLEQDFNSLDAQREACEAFILSQKHEGWTALLEMYDDGGISGATMERPALKRLLSDIKAGRIDTVMVYKIDRLTRSLGDFAKIVEVFRDGIVSKRRIDKYGRQIGGKPLARDALYLMLQNRIYRGEIVHKQASYPGQHASIIDETLWSAVQKRLADNRVERHTGASASEPSLLAGLIYDHIGERMTPTHANKKGRRYRYYVSQSLIKRGRPKGSDAGRRVPAGDVEQLVADRITGFLRDEAAVFDTIETFVADVNERRSIVRQAADLAGRWRDLGPPEKRRILQSLVARIELGRESVKIEMQPGRIPEVVDPDSEAML